MWDILGGCWRGRSPSPGLNGCGKVGELGVKGDGVSGVVGGSWSWRTGWSSDRFWGWGMVRGVEDLGHLAMVGAVEVLTEGSVGVLVFKGPVFSLLFLVTFLATLASKLRSGWSKGVIVDVPGQWGKVEPRGGFREVVSGVGSVESCQVCSWASQGLALALFMLSRGQLLCSKRGTR